MVKTTEVNDKEAALGVAANGVKVFKTSSEVENFYRFIHENGLRAEASTLMKLVLKKISPAKKRGRKKNLQ